MSNKLKTDRSRGLYHSSFEKDACGVGCVVNIQGIKSHSIVSDALKMLENMEHRGATGSDPESGDGAGILTQIPHTFFKEEMKQFGIKLPAEGTYGVGMVFFPPLHQVRKQCREIMNECIRELDMRLLGYRLVPTDEKVPGHEAKSTMPYIEQLFVQPKNSDCSGVELERRLLVLRKIITNRIREKVPADNGYFHIVSLSARTIIYKGQLRTDQVGRFYEDLKNRAYKSALATIHSRFSTNTFPNWKLAQPFRYLAHNGEINTIKGNLNKMKSKENLMQSPYFSEEEMQQMLPITLPKNSDSANLDAMVEMLTLSGRPLPHVMMMLVPEAWQDNRQMDTHRKAFYKFHASLIEPWDGPAALFFTDGIQIGACLDRNGLRPARYCITKNGRLIMASEVGVIPIKPADVISRGRLKPGQMLLADTASGKIYDDAEIKNQVCQGKPYFEWINEQRIKLRLMEVEPKPPLELSDQDLFTKQHAIGMSEEDLKMLILPMAETAKEPIGSMGADAPLAVLSRQPQHLANYFKQFFAQVSNPPIDPLRERSVMSLFTRVGEAPNILDETPLHTKQVHISNPVLSELEFQKLKATEAHGFTHYEIDATFNADSKFGLLAGIERICLDAENAVRDNYKILIINNTKISKYRAAIPSLAAVGAVQHHLIKRKLRSKTGIVVFASDVWETHHFATVIGYGASAIYPCMAFQTIRKLMRSGNLNQFKEVARYEQNYIDAICGGLLKILSKMGISTLQSYQGSQIFEVVGLGSDIINKCFKGTISRLEGMNFEDLENECLQKHFSAFPQQTKLLPPGGFYQWRRRGEQHLLHPDVIHLLQKSTKLDDYELYKQYSTLIRNHQEKQITLRSLLQLKKTEPVPLEEVEPIESILKRFATGAMSFGSLSHEAHSTLAIAMNRIGGKSNSGEGGEDESRYQKRSNGDWERSAIKQVASGRFGVNSYYLSQAEEIQIKIAQGAKPGEGGQLPGFKVDKWIAKVRYSTPGVGLISPPPHHDIYSIEDLKQLIFDLKNANPKARINVKLVALAGVGTIASGVAKAKADVIMISGADGGTGASPLSSIRHAGLPWEMGLSEAHQTLVKNNLHSRVTLQTDGKLMTGYDVAVAALLGAEEFGVATAALITEGCIMMRKCHLNTCPVGVATQDPQLRQLFTGKPEYVVNLFRFLAMELREIMASLGFRKVNEMVGQSHLLKVNTKIDHPKINKLDLRPILNQDAIGPNVGLYKQLEQEHGIEKVLDIKLVKAWNKYGAHLHTELIKIKNTDRSVGARLSYEISTKHGAQGLGDQSLVFKFMGAAGQSFGAFLAQGVRFELEGECNDYVGKGLSGGHLIIKPYKESSYVAAENIIIGNVVLYGAIAGEVYINGMAGERFAVRNSGAEAVVEGIGDHGCEYMTGGKVLVLGETGNNFAAGMSGGMAFVWDKADNFANKCNTEMVDLELPAAEDIQWIYQKLEKHAGYTGSLLAKQLLKNWSVSQQQFVKVMPHDLKRVLAAQEEQKLQTVA